MLPFTYFLGILQLAVSPVTSLMGNRVKTVGNELYRSIARTFVETVPTAETVPGDPRGPTTEAFTDLDDTVYS